jgi:predicted Zn-dependent protease
VTRDELARRTAAALDGAGRAQLLATAWHERSVRATLAGSRIAAVDGGERSGVELLAIVEGHVARASVLGPDDDATRAAAARAVAAAEALARADTSGDGGDHPGLPAPVAPRAHHGFDAATARLDGWLPALHAALAAAGDGPPLDGRWEAGVVTTALAATSGLRAADATTDAGLVLATRTGGAPVHRIAVAAANLDAAALAREALAADGAAPHAPAGAHEGGGTAPDEHPGVAGAGQPSAATQPPSSDALLPTPGDPLVVVLGPDAVAAVLALLGRCAFNGLAHAEGRGALSGRLGTRVAAPAINLSDTPRFAGAPTCAFDAEGVPKAPLPLVQDGVAHRVVHDLRSAARAGGGARSTGHALLPGGAPGGPQPRNFVLLGGGAADEAELASTIERGVYVPRLDGVTLLDPATAAFAAVARGARAIEGGEIGRVLPALRLGATGFGILSATEALSSRPRLTGWIERPSDRPRRAWSAVCPALRTSMTLA